MTGLTGLPPLFDNCTDEQLASTSMEMSELVTKVNELRSKQLEGGGLTDDEVKLGIGYIIQIRQLRGALNMEVPTVVAKAVAEKLEDLF